MGYFYRRFPNEDLNKLYELLENVTPLAADCGALCGAACCKGDDGDGMILFPGERAFFECRPGFAVRRNDAYGYDFLVCSGGCDREVRPLSCRIFPYFFYVSQGGAVSAAPDVRALGRCPLADGKRPLSPVFLRRMRMCAKVIGKDPALYGFCRRLSDAFTDFGLLSAAIPDGNRNR